MEIEKQVLSREQMAHLVELGVDTSDASMCWVTDEDGKSEEYWHVTTPNNFLMPYKTIPTYTIGDLIEKLPKEIDLGELIIRWDKNQIGYGYWVHNELINVEPWQINFREQSIRDALYDLLCWIIKNHKELIK